MAQKTDEELKQFFETGDYPTQGQFADLIDSKLHKTAAIPMSKVTDLLTMLNGIYTKVQIDLLLAALVPIQGNCNTTAQIVFTNRTTVREIEILSAFNGTVKIGVAPDDDTWGAGEYVAGEIAVFFIAKTAYKASESFYITTTNSADYLIRKA